MKSSLFSNILFSTLFYTTLVSTTFVLPVVLAGRDDARMAPVDRDTQVWERSVDAPVRLEPQRDSLLPQTDAAVSGTVAKQAPIDKSGPDAAMIKQGRARGKTIKL